MKTIIARQMHVQLVLDDAPSTLTNLDTLKGKVVVRLFATTPLSNITVKLEGESKTRLKGLVQSATGQVRAEAGVGDKLVIREETHKILYKTDVVFPKDQPEIRSASGRYLTLNPGSYSYPFSFKLPFNNGCKDTAPSAVSSLAQVARVGLKASTIPVQHVKRTLPPTLATFPGLAEIRYYLKATVSRKEFYKENPRVVQNLIFFPIEPPRSLSSGAESYARRQHQFGPATSVSSKGKSRLFEAFKKAPSAQTQASGQSGPPTISVDLRLPNPSIITCNEDLPMRLIVKRSNASNEPLFLQSLHIQLHGITHISANEMKREESSNWVIMSRSNMGFPLSSSNVKGERNDATEIVLDSGLWKRHPLPNSVSPSFQTCNISRKYELEVQVGIGFGNSHAKNTAILPLRHPVEVYSGIAPPAALVEAMATKRQVPLRKPVRQATSPRPEKTPAFSAPLHLQTDVGAASSSGTAIPPTSQIGPSTPIATPTESSTPQYRPLPAGEEEPPPSYEDAVASDMPAVTGPRGDYQQPPVGPGGFSDEKGRRDS